MNAPKPGPHKAAYLPNHPNALPWMHGGDVVVRQLQAFGIEHLFTLTGGHISSLYDGARFTDLKIVDFRHEQAAVHAADAMARLRRDVSVAALTSGPGVTGGLTGVANAYYSDSPVVVFGGRNPFVSDGAGNLQEAPHLDLMRPVTKHCAALYELWQAPEVIYNAFAAARAPRSGPAYIDLPVDVQLTRIPTQEAPALRANRWPVGPSPDPGVLRDVARALGAASQPVILAGTGAYWAMADAALDAVARAAKIPVFLNGMARGMLGRDHPYQIFGNRKEALRGTDVVLLLGVDIDFRLGFGQAGAIHADAAIIQVDTNPERIGRNRAATIGVTADIAQFLRGLLAEDSLFGRSEPADWGLALRDKDAARAEHARRSVTLSGSPIDPRQFNHAISTFLDADATVIGDGGDIVTSFAGGFRPGGPGHWMDPGPFGCLGIGAPFAMSARLHRQRSQVAVVFGDGSFGFNGFEFESAVRQRLPFVGIIGNDGAWGEMRTFNEDLFGEVDLPAQKLSQSTSYEKVVEGLGGYGQRVEKAEDIIPALGRAFNSGVPAVVNVILDPAVRRENTTISGKHVAMTYGRGNKDAFKRQ
jgi:acetolactate synthase-1/2/3 large subunit